MAKKKRELRLAKKNERCGKGWTPVEIRVGRAVRRACIRGKVVRTARGEVSKPGQFAQSILNVLDVGELLGVLSAL
jgi:hypothetical protein